MGDATTFHWSMMVLPVLHSCNYCRGSSVQEGICQSLISSESSVSAQHDSRALPFYQNSQVSSSIDLVLTDYLSSPAGTGVLIMI